MPNPGGVCFRNALTNMIPEVGGTTIENPGAHFAGAIPSRSWYSRRR